jgi:hypothetical protein
MAETNQNLIDALNGNREAIDALREFQARQNLPLKLDELVTLESGGVFKRSGYYRKMVATKNLSANYQVFNQSGGIVSASIIFGSDQNGPVLANRTSTINPNFYGFEPGEFVVTQYSSSNTSAGITLNGQGGSLFGTGTQDLGTGDWTINANPGLFQGSVDVFGLENGRVYPAKLTIENFCNIVLEVNDLTDLYFYV